MSRYIDADALGERLKGERDFYKKMYDCMQQPCEQDERAIIGAYYTAYSKSYHIVKDAPTVDAVPVVRCKECIEYRESVGACHYFNYDPTDEMDFCSHGIRADGERKDGAE